MHRIGVDDYWYLQSSGSDGKRIERLAISTEQQTLRQCALIRAISEFIATPCGAKMAAWAPHVFLTEGAIILSNARTAPFVSPLKVDLKDAASEPVQSNPDYRKQMSAASNNKDTWCWEFDDVQSLLNAVEMAETEIRRK